MTRDYAMSYAGLYSIADQFTQIITTFQRTLEGWESSLFSDSLSVSLDGSPWLR